MIATTATSVPWKGVKKFLETSGCFYPSSFPTNCCRGGNLLRTKSGLCKEWKVVPRDRIELSTPAFSGLCSAN